MAKRRPTGFLYPQPVEPYDLQCIILHIPREAAYRQAFWGHLFQLTHAQTWWQNDAVSPGELLQVAQYWHSLIWPDYLRYLEGGGGCEEDMPCCSDPVLRFNEDGTSEVSTDNGATWTENNADPRFLPIPFIPRPEPPGEERRCNAAGSVRHLLEEATDQIIATAGAWATIQALLDNILVIIAAIFPGVGTIAALIIAGIITAIFFVGQTAFNAAMTSSVYDLFQCLVYCQLDEDGHINFEGWVSLKLDIYEQIPGIAGNWLWGWVSSLGVSGINASTGMFTGVTEDCSGCNCDVCGDPTSTSPQGGTNLIPRPDLGENWWEITTVAYAGGGGDNYYAQIDMDCCYLNAYNCVPPEVNAAAGNRVALDCAGDPGGSSNYRLGACSSMILFRSFGVATFEFELLPCP